MNNLLVIIHACFAVAAGLATFFALRWASRVRHRQDYLESVKLIQQWPGIFSRISTVISFLIPLVAQLARPSQRTQRELLMAGAPPRFNDLEFSKMCWVIAICCGAFGFLMALLFNFLGPGLSGSVMLGLPFVLGALGLLLPQLKLRDISGAAQRRISRDFPSFLDVLALTLESGQNFQSALQLSVQRLAGQDRHGRLKSQLQEVLRDIRSGQTKVNALQRFAHRVALPEIRQFVASISAADTQGVSVVALLRRQAEQLRTSRALAAERHAMKLPVKLLAPLGICIFPCTFLVLAFPISIWLSDSGLF